MLNETEKAVALEIVLAAKDEKDFPIINDRLCRGFAPHRRGLFRA